MTDHLQFTVDPGAFLALAEDYLTADPVLCSVVASTANREASSGCEATPGSPHWYVTVHGPDRVVGAAMRTAPDPPHPLFVLPMPDAAAVDLARVLHDRGESVGGANGALPAVRVFAQEIARLNGGSVGVEVPTRLFELRHVIDPRPAPGTLRLVTTDDVDLVTSWLDWFHHDADFQAGRDPGDQPAPRPEQVRAQIEAGRYWLWWHQDRPVHLSGLNPDSFGVQRIGPVYTPPAERGRGWASAAVAQLCRQILSAGARPCLFTDQHNPVSNHVYTAIGFEPVVDMVNLTIDAASSPRRVDG